MIEVWARVCHQNKFTFKQFVKGIKIIFNDYDYYFNVGFKGLVEIIKEN